MVSAAAVAALHLALLWLVLRPGATPPTRAGAETLAAFDVSPPPPAAPPPSPPPERRATPAAPTGVAGRTARRSPVAAPSPVVVLPPPPVIAAAVPDTGSAAIGGAAASGVGTGAGNSGSGAGAGGAGNGTGSGGARARLLSGAIRDRDYPAAERHARVQGTVTAAFTVGTDGRARDCRIVRSSGSAALDATTCRLIEARFRYTPATDALGTPVAEERGWQQRWWIAGAPGDASPPGASQPAAS